MTTLYYVTGPQLAADEVLVDQEFALAMSCKTDDPERSNHILYDLASRGVISAHLQLQHRYQWGDTLPKDSQKALEHLLSAVTVATETARAANASEMARLMAASAMFQLAQEYLNEEPDDDPDWSPTRLVPTNREEGLKWLREAVKLNYRPAEVALEEMLREDLDRD